MIMAHSGALRRCPLNAQQQQQWRRQTLLQLPPLQACDITGSVARWLPTGSVHYAMRQNATSPSRGKRSQARPEPSGAAPSPAFIRTVRGLTFQFA